MAALGGFSQASSARSSRLVTSVTRFFFWAPVKCEPGESGEGLVKCSTSQSAGLVEGSFARSGPYIDRPSTWHREQLSLAKYPIAASSSGGSSRHGGGGLSPASGSSMLGGVVATAR